MPEYVYEGPGSSISIAGQSLAHGEPTTLEGRAAEAAEAHPEIRAIGSGRAAKATTSGTTPTGLGRYAALKARAKGLGLAATGKADDLEAAIAAEEQRLAAGDGGDAG